ncbi:uncharacterized protein MONOS_3711 [Monocercomonoides exilis]|uniref:uncharacterized protein n=1 Tax=Monocercomonoides exilis TaxID=2049356 RepID=UPI00355A3F00|nr:hypothetical protein MONOS_3711 [Monocercomonoides exilis]|eukprot:MONOS_3711.1-p1 / transcript=MONOS_3711.1 / gene=MONOS_3711 / organism=Monocercomonoides_exilis_PA203 / gene_product=unspecified product / transcript_product=unspecified product / location=Mono_scaffold00090:58020-58986(-) / protein_length=141 / sequence_SO=supercontig / SO=protein_coding / is_pseudo=false
MLLQKIRDKERISKMTSGLAEQLQEKDKIIRMRERKILELTEKHNIEEKGLQEQLVAMKEKMSQEEFETVHVLWIPITLHSFVRMKRLLKPLKTELKYSLFLENYVMEEAAKRKEAIKEQCDQMHRGSPLTLSSSSSGAV